MVFISNGAGSFNVEFRHVSKFGKHPKLHSKSQIRAITTCVVNTPSLIAIEHAICLDPDNFSRIEGRLRSLQKVLTSYRPLAPVAEMIWNEYLQIANVRIPFSLNAHDFSALHKAEPRVKLPPEEREKKIKEGESVRSVRMQMGRYTEQH